MLQDWRWEALNLPLKHGEGMLPPGCRRRTSEDPSWSQLALAWSPRRAGRIDDAAFLSPVFSVLITDSQSNLGWEGAQGHVGQALRGAVPIKPGCTEPCLDGLEHPQW